MKNIETTKSTNPPSIVVLIAWLWVGFPLTWGLWETFHKTLELFK